MAQVTGGGEMVVKPAETYGLGDEPRGDWPNPPQPRPPTSRPFDVRPEPRPIDRLAPGSDAHAHVLSYLLKRLEASERQMSNFYPRWKAIEIRDQAYINLQDWEQTLKEKNDRGSGPPKIVSIVIPYSFSVVSVIVTYLTHIFLGRKPTFQVGTYNGDLMENARAMEVKLQYDADHTRIARQLIQSFMDGQRYGVSAVLCRWQVEQAVRTVRYNQAIYSPFGEIVGYREQPQRERRVVYEGNAVEALDPYMFFPDPRVPMERVSRDGEFVFWRSFRGRHELLAREADGQFSWVKNVPTTLPRNEWSDGSESERGLRAYGYPAAAASYRMALDAGQNFSQIDQGTIEIIPHELGLGSSDRPEKWLFTIKDKAQIIQADPFVADHGRHPVAVGEPYSTGYTVGNLGITDITSQIQDGLSWLFNARMDNVRKGLNDMWLVDPSMIEMQDIKRPEPGKLIRLKRTAFGQDVRAAITQFPVSDVTQSHVRDMELLLTIGQQVTGISENLMGVQDSGGRKTATEVRQTGEAAVSRLAFQGRLLSSQQICDLTEMMTLNNQQHVSEPFYVSVVGKDGRKHSLFITPSMLTGDFYFPIHDGTLPIDRVALFDVWQKVLEVVLRDQGLRMSYDINKLFEHVADLGGAQGVASMRIQPASPGAIAQGAQAGNFVTPQDLAGSLGPGRRLLEGMGPQMGA